MAGLAKPALEIPELLQSFIAQAPVSVMTRMLIGNVLSPRVMDEIFARHARVQYTHALAFSTTTRLLSRVVLRQAPSVNASYQQEVEEIGVSVSALYQKLAGTEPAVCTALVRETAQTFRAILEQLQATSEEPVAGYRMRTLDGNHFAATERRLKVHQRQPPALPGQTLALYDHATGLISEIIACPDAHAQERSGLSEVLSCVRARDLVMGDRNFCVKDFMEKLHDREVKFLIRRHGVLPLVTLGERKKRGRCSTGVVYEQDVQFGNHVWRAITVVRRKPLRDSSDSNKTKSKKKKSGKRTVILLTNLSREEGAAVKLAELYLKRWKIEECFRRLTMDLRCEVNTLGYPAAALLCFALAVLAANALATLERCIQSHWQPDACPPTAREAKRLQAKEQKAKAQAQEATTTNTVPTKAPATTRQKPAPQVSHFRLAEEVSLVTTGMMIAVPNEVWHCYDRMTVKQLATVLRTIAQGMRTKRYHKMPDRSPRQRKKIKRRAGRHVSTFKLLHPNSKAAWSP